MSKKNSKLKTQLKQAAEKVLSMESTGEDVKIKFYENGTDKFLIEKTLDVFLNELQEIMDNEN